MTVSAPDVVELVDGPDALERCGPAFDLLCDRTGVPVTSRRLWLQTWADCYAPWTPWLVLVWRGRELAAAAPLARRRRVGLLHVVGLGNGPSDDLRLPALDSEAARTLADAVHDALNRQAPWLLRLEQIPPDDPVVAALRARLPLDRLEPGEGMPRVRIVDRDPTAYLSKNTKKALAKIRNRLQRSGLEPETRWTSDVEQIRAVLPELQAVHRARDEQLGRRSDHDDARAARFHEQVIVRHAARGEVELLTLRLAGELAAYVCAFADGAALRSWDNRLAPAWSDFSAGRLANTEALRHAVTSSRYDELDWMQGEEPYKLQSATEIVPTANLVAWSSLPVQAGHAAVQRLRASKRSSPALTRTWWLIADVRRRTGGTRS